MVKELILNKGGKTMKYDFKTVVDRSGCGSLKWNGHKGASTEYVPLSVADMEFVTAEPIKQALKDVAENRILGYTEPTDEYYDAVTSWMKRKHDFDVKKEWIITTPGVVDALAVLIDAETKPGDSVIILTPVYYPFDISVTAKSRKIVYSKLINNGGHYEIDFDDLAEKAKRKNVTALLFCNPHNPVGRVWTREELKRVADICCENGLFIIDDEIHNDLIMPGYTHTVMANVSDEVKNHIAVCTAPSKTFNIAGVQCSNIIIPNETARTKALICSMANMQTALNIFAYSACIAAYTECDEWLDELLTVIKGNADFVRDFMAENFSEIKVIPLEGTYLLWLDMRGTGLSYTEMKKLLEECHIYLDNGEMFGREGRGFQRINIACPRETLKKAMERFKEGLNRVYEGYKINGAPYHKTLTEGEKIENFVYTSAYGTNRTLGNKKALIVFSRFFDCPVTKGMLKIVKGIYPALSYYNCDVKFVIQSGLDEIAPAQKDYPFELIADPQAKLYDMYNIFEADGMMGVVGGDRLVGAAIGKDIKKILRIKSFNKLAGAILGDEDEESNGKRQLQLPAFICVDETLTVTYSHYCETLSDMPSAVNLIKGIKKR